ncbi:MAG: hypothetical protein K2H35_04275 [Muribaculaceae bacterium]|nr:hypothetical protein [Muribaculaceae bacterium]
MAILNDKTIEIDAVISITKTNLIKITEDKLELTLLKHFNRLKKSKEWLAALSFSLTILLVLLTSDFQEKWGIPGDGWQMLFLLTFIVSIVYLVISIVNCIKHNITVDTIIVAIKAQSEDNNRINISDDNKD